ncbi:MAG: PCMD domain-containing protein, partial [Odoribacter sp.]|nr:PCMD domain-containing protein [Odoribacter sp.]
LCTAPGETTVSDFEIVAKDQYGQTGNECKFALSVVPPVFDFVNTPGEGNVWATRTIYDVRYISEVRKPVVECQGNDGIWKTLETTLTNTAADEYECLAKGLAPATEYAFRVRLGGHILDAGRYTTEVAAQVPNSGFEEWYYTRPKDVKYWEVYYVCREGEVPVWNTMNQLTTSEGGTSTSVFKRNGCRYSANSGTIQTTDAKGGSYAALVRTVGWGGGNSANAISGKMGTCEHVTSGELYLGSYDVDSKKGVYGYDFTSRPVKLSFFYKYVPKNSDDWFEATIVVKDKAGEVIAEKTVCKSGGINVYTQEIIELDYRIMKRAASMYILFKSTGNSVCLEANTTNLTPPPGANLSNGEYLGSQLYIDDIELIYE